MCDSTSSALVTTIPQVYGTLLSDSAWTLNMRFRSFIWPDNLPHNLICKCSREITTTHLLNCKHFITFRSKVHDAVRDQLYCMCKSHRIESFLEPLLSNLFDAENDFHKNNRGDVILPGLDGSFILLDVMSVDPCNEIPTRSLPNLRFCLKKLQHHLVKLYEGLNYEVRFGLAKTKNPAFGNFLKDIRDSSAAALVTQVPSVYGLLLKNNEWLLNMRFRCFLWPNNLPNHLTCKCGKPLLFTHLLNCKHFITFRSKVHNNVRDQIYVMCKSYQVNSFLEPLLSKLILDDPNIDSTRYNRASMGLTRDDLVVPGLNGSFTILDAMSIDPCNSSNEHFINSDVNNPLLAGEKYKIAKYAKPISSVNENSHAQYNLCPFVFSLLGSLGKAAMAFLEDFVVVVKERTGRIFNRVYWQNRIVFSIFKGMVTLISDSLSSFGKFSESLAINCFDVGEAGFEDVEF
ncbi:hypothetical protein P9112_006292 [Eukaryota sp. TZLM1-RC]